MKPRASLLVSYIFRMKNLTIRLGAGVIGLSFLATAVPAFADTSTSTASTTQGSYNVACVQTAVGVHEDAKISAHNAYNSAVSAALVVRKNEMVSAWAQTSFTARMTALKAAVEKYRASIKVARTAYKNATATSNTTFTTSMKTCGATKADIKGQTKAEKREVKHEEKEEKREGKINLGLGLDGNFGFHFGQNKDKKDR